MACHVQKMLVELWGESELMFVAPPSGMTPLPRVPEEGRVRGGEETEREDPAAQPGEFRTSCLPSQMCPTLSLLYVYHPFHVRCVSPCPCHIVPQQPVLVICASPCPCHMCLTLSYVPHLVLCASPCPCPMCLTLSLLDVPQPVLVRCASLCPCHMCHTISLVVMLHLVLFK